MPAKIFISCGQHTDIERKTARDVGLWLEGEGYQPYVATEVTSVFELNSEIIDRLKNSDYYLLINFPRETVTKEDEASFIRGSIYSHQEFGIAYASGIDRIIAVNHHAVSKEGMLGTLINNAPVFRDYAEVLPLIKEAVTRNGWSANFSRGLVTCGSHWGNPCNFADHTIWRGYVDQTIKVRVFHVHLENRRLDRGAFDTMVRMVSIVAADGTQSPSPDLSPLKASGHNVAYSQAIWPGRTGEIDSLSVRYDRAQEIYLNSAMDLSPRAPIIDAIGTFRLNYEMFAQEYPVRQFTIELNVTGDAMTTTAQIIG